MTPLPLFFPAPFSDGAAVLPPLKIRPALGHEQRPAVETLGEPLLRRKHFTGPKPMPFALATLKRRRHGGRRDGPHSTCPNACNMFCSTRRLYSVSVPPAGSRTCVSRW